MVQAVLTDKNANIDQLLTDANTKAQRAIDAAADPHRTSKETRKVWAAGTTGGPTPGLLTPGARTRSDAP